MIAFCSLMEQSWIKYQDTYRFLSVLCLNLAVIVMLHKSKAFSLFWIYASGGQEHCHQIKLINFTCLSSTCDGYVYLPHKVKRQYVHFISHAENFLLYWKIPEENSRRSIILFYNERQYLPYQTLYTYNILAWKWFDQKFDV